MASLRPLTKESALVVFMPRAALATPSLPPLRLASRGLVGEGAVQFGQGLGEEGVGRGAYAAHGPWPPCPLRCMGARSWLYRPHPRPGPVFPTAPLTPPSHGAASSLTWDRTGSWCRMVLTASPWSLAASAQARGLAPTKRKPSTCIAVTQ